MKIQLKDREKIFVKHISNMDLVSRIYKDISQLSNMKIDNPINMGRDLNRHITREDIGKASKLTCKEGQYH